MHNAAHIFGVFENGGGCTLSANRYPSEMVWFVNDREDPSQRVGLHCHRENGAYVVTIVDPDGSETATTFDDEDSMTTEAVRIHLGLVNRGWRALPRTE